MRYLKINKSNTELIDQINGYQNGNNRIELREDAKGDFWIHEGIKNSPHFASIDWDLLELKEVITLIKEDEI